MLLSKCFCLSAKDGEKTFFKCKLLVANRPLCQLNVTQISTHPTVKARWSGVHFGLFESGWPPGSNFTACMLVRVALFYWETCSYILLPSSLTSDGSHGAHEYIQEALCGHERCLLRWHCSTVWVLLVLGVPSNHSWFHSVRRWVLSQWFQHTSTPVGHPFATQAQHVAGKARLGQIASTNLLFLSWRYKE